MLKIEGLTYSYGKHSPEVLRGVDLELNDGEIGVLLGRNGCGKTTLFQNLLGICTPSGGRMFFDGEDLNRMPRRERARRIAYVPQHIHFGDLSVYDSILLGRVSRFGLRAGASDRDAVDRIIEEMGLQQLAFRNAEELSGGEKQKIAIARALAQEPGMLVFDEPTGNLDIANEELIIEETKLVAHVRNISVLCSLHDLNRAMCFGDRFFFMKNGKITCSGGQEAFTPETVRHTFDISVKIVEVENQRIIIGGKTNEIA